MLFTEDMKNQTSLLVLLVSLSLQTGCAKKTVDEDTGSSTTTNNPDDTPPPRGYLWVHHKGVKGALRYTHLEGDWSNQCKVDLDAATGKDIACLTESTELDLMHIGMELEYNVPAHPKCPYVATMTPYFFQFEPPRVDGTPSALNKPHIEPSSIEAELDLITGVYTVKSSKYADGTTDNPYYKRTIDGLTCSFDHRDIGGPNCCEGNYVYTLTEKSAAGSTTTIDIKNWSGSHANCLNGPAMELNESSTGWPSMRYWRMAEQADTLSASAPVRTFESPKELLGRFHGMLSDVKTAATTNFGSLKIASLFDKKFVTTRYLATYQASTAAKGFTDILNYYDVEYPPGYRYLASYADPRYYTILCMDQAQEVTARIRLRVREWNTRSALAQAKEPTSGEDNESGSEGDIPEFPLHDRYDWEDADSKLWMPTYEATGVRSSTGTTNGYPGWVF